MDYLSLKLIYIANIMVAGYVGVASLFFPGLAGKNLFSGLAEGDVAISITGAFWIAIALLSVAGLFLPIKMNGAGVDYPINLQRIMAPYFCIACTCPQ